ncbi:pentapeptide repeat protein [Rhodococcus sp. OK519]|uniref:pentapeptide repeat-containing protein n=1 Tax=Rhodococcus sp. OK519 TaxID=2135729 RepID=UPI000D353C7D|nr:pentapeptide repeat protein [Rhodococcus sp. OK519]
MTTPTPHGRRARSRVVAASGAGIFAAASIVTAGAGVATAQTPEEILAAACNHYEPSPDLWADPPRQSDCTFADLTGAGLTGANLLGANLANANLTNANLNGANLANANLNGAVLDGTILNGALLTGTDLGGTYAFSINLAGRDLTGARLSGANWPGANLAGANLAGTDLSNSTLTTADLSGANLTGAYLSGANLSGADLTDTNMTDSNMYQTILTGANFTGSTEMPQNRHVAASSPAGASVTISGEYGRYLAGCTRPTDIAIPLGVPYLYPVGTTTLTCAISSTGPTGGRGTLTVTVDPYAVAPAFADTAPVTLAGTVDTELTRTFAVNGAPAPQVSVTAGALPDGLALSAAGALSGTPTTAGPFWFTITAANGTAPDATLQVSGTITAATETPAQIITTVCGSYVANPAPGSFSDCSGKDLTGANLTGANLTGANLTGTDLAGANLTGVDLYHANLAGANLEGADLTGVTLTGANLTGTSAIPNNITVAAQSAAGAPATWITPDMPTGLTLGACTPASGTVFPAGPSTVTCAVTSVTGDVLTTGTGTFTVTVTATPVVDPPTTGSFESIFGS